MALSNAEIRARNDGRGGMHPDSMQLLAKQMAHESAWFLKAANKPVYTVQVDDGLYEARAQARNEALMKSMQMAVDAAHLTGALRLKQPMTATEEIRLPDAGCVKPGTVINVPNRVYGTPDQARVKPYEYYAEMRENEKRRQAELAVWTSDGTGNNDINPLRSAERELDAHIARRKQSTIDRIAAYQSRYDVSPPEYTREQERREAHEAYVTLASRNADLRDKVRSMSEKLKLAHDRADELEAKLAAFEAKEAEAKAQEAEQRKRRAEQTAYNRDVWRTHGRGGFALAAAASRADNGYHAAELGMIDRHKPDFDNARGGCVEHVEIPAKPNHYTIRGW